MPTTRRAFVQSTSALGSMLSVAPSLALAAAPRGTRQTAPATPPAYDDQAAKALAGSPLPAHTKLAELALDAAKKGGASYADARLVRWRSERVGATNDHVDRVRRSEDLGIGIRVLKDGAWGFAATPSLTEKSVAAATRAALDTATQGGALAKRLGAPPIELAPAPAARGSWVTPHVIDPMSVSAADKAALLVEAARVAHEVPGIGRTSASVECVAEDKLLLTSDGTQVHQLFFRIIPELRATAVHTDKGFSGTNHDTPPMQAGWEYVEGIDLVGAAPKLAELSLQKLHAPGVTPGEAKTIVLAPSNLWLTIHESIGHPTELDRAMGLEADYAGTSFIAADAAGKLRIGSDIVNLVADRTQPGGLATVAWDDEGVASGRWPIVEDGRFVGWQTTRDQAAWVGEPASRGCCYGQRYRGVPFARMPNISLQPGPEGYVTEDLINATEDGVYITGRGSWSIDHQRYNFQFSGQTFWEIKRGRITRALRDVAYQANTVDFWKSCDMIGGKGTYRLGGSFHDGKGQPGQSNAVSHGCPPARFVARVIDAGGAK